jgi:hypothetical protein
MASFSGDPVTQWLSELGSDRRMKILEDFWFADEADKLWVAPKGSIVNGASIPEALWSLVGSPYTGDYRRASVVHDVACNDPTISREAADDMFYEACLVGGCTLFQAKLLRAGVCLGAWASSNDLILGTASPYMLSPDKSALAENYTASELRIRAKFTELADKLRDTPNDLAKIKIVIANELNTHDAPKNSIYLPFEKY